MACESAKGSDCLYTLGRATHRTTSSVDNLKKQSQCRKLARLAMPAFQGFQGTPAQSSLLVSEAD